MNRRFPLIFLPLLLVFLVACGTLQITVINPPSPVQPAASETPAEVNTPAPPVVASATPSQAAVTQQPDLQSTLLLPLRLEKGERLSIQEIHMIDGETGWAIGHGQASAMDHILRTMDGGANWIEVTPPRILAQNSLVFNVALASFGDLEHAWVLYSTETLSTENSASMVWFTSDGGLSWKPSQPLDYGNLQQETVLPAILGFSDTMHGWLMVHLGAGMGHDYVAIFTTADGGETWMRKVDPNQDNLVMSCAKTSLVFNSADRGWLTGNCGGVQSDLYVYNSLDGGATWQKVTLPAPLDLPDLFTKSDNVCGAEKASFNGPQVGRLLVRCSLGATGMIRSWLYTTRDGAHTWVPYDLPVPFGVYDFSTGQMGWWLGTADPDGKQGISLFFSRDSGLSWSPVINPGWTGQVDFVDAQNGWVIARAGARTALVKTSDGGKTWKEILPIVRE